MPLKNYVGLFAVLPMGAQGGRFIFREYFGFPVCHSRCNLGPGAVGVFRRAMGNLARLIGGTEYAMTTVSRVR